MSDRTAILFMCVANSARSQLAEGLARRMVPAGVEVYSAGSNPARLHPYAARVLAERGIDTTKHYSKSLRAVPTDSIGTVITLCAEEVCPVWPGPVERLLWPIADPAATRGGDDEVIAAFRVARDCIESRLTEYLSSRRGGSG